MIKIKFNFRYFSVANFLLKAYHILNSVKNNIALFPAPVPSTAALELEIDRLGQLTDLAEEGDRVQVANRRAQKAIVENMLKQLSGYVINVANNQPNIAEASGFDLWASKTPVGQVSVQNVKAKTSGMPGDGKVILSWKKSKGVLLSSVQHAAGTPTAETVWTEISATGKSKDEVTVDSGTHSFRIVVTGSSSVAASTPVSIVVG